MLQTTKQDIAITDIKPNAKNFRKLFDDAKQKALEVSVKHQGVLQDILVRKVKNGVPYEIVAGERRYRAAKANGIQVLRCNVLVTDDPKEAALAGFEENEQREGLTSYERAAGLAVLVNEYKFTGQDIHKRTGLGVSTINKALQQVTALHPAILQAWEGGNGLLTKETREKLVKWSDKDEQLDNWKSLVEHGAFVAELDHPPGATPTGEGGGAEGGTPAAVEPPATVWELGGRAKVKERHGYAMKALKALKDGNKRVEADWCRALVEYVLCRREKPPEGVEEPQAPAEAKPRQKRKTGTAAAPTA